MQTTKAQISQVFSPSGLNKSHWLELMAVVYEDLCTQILPSCTSSATFQTKWTNFDAWGGSASDVSSIMDPSEAD